jgi:dipeptidyl aminopeptidase/acylaminoacyl peptidase
MKTTFRLVTLAFLTIAFASLLCGQNANRQILVPQGCSKALLSPDGSHVAMLRRDAENLNALLIIRIQDLEATYIYPRDHRSTRKSFLDLAWADTTNLILTSDAAADARPLHRYTLGHGGAETLSSSGYWDIVDGRPNQSTYLVTLRENQWSPGKAELIERDLNNNLHREVLYTTTSAELVCVTDHQHLPRFLKASPSAEAGPQWFWNDGSSWVPTQLSPWIRVLAAEYGKPHSAFVTGWVGTNGASVSLYDFKADATGNKILDHPEVDISRYVEPLMNPTPRAILGLRVDAALPSDVWLTRNVGELQQKVDAAMPGTLNQIQSWDLKFRTAVVKRTLLDSPAHYVLFDSTANEVTLLVVDGGDIREARLGRSSAVNIEAGDGTILSAFLTVPRVSEPKKLPLVVLLEPTLLSGLTRFEWNPVSSYLATQGFVVLRMNTRLSAGLIQKGRDHHKSLQGMSTLFADIDKGVSDLVASGLVDPQRVAIAGSGAAAWAAATAPAHCKTKFRAAVALNGVFDLADYRKSYNHSDSPRHVINLPFAAPDSGLTDDQLLQLSPLEQANKLPEALFLSCGEWSSPEFKRHFNDFRSRAARNKVKVRVFQDNWWGTNMQQGPFMRAWEEASQMLVDYTKPAG